MKSKLPRIYLVIGILVCGWFTTAAALGWRATDYGILKSLSSGGGRAIGGSWGGGK
ncbi:MAG: hypothetical protein AAFX06_18095 [Planctomycetota bacterium]